MDFVRQSSPVQLLHYGVWSFGQNNSAAKSLVQFLQEREQVGESEVSSDGHYLPPLFSMSDFDIWSEASAQAPNKESRLSGRRMTEIPGRNQCQCRFDIYLRRFELPSDLFPASADDCRMPSHRSRDYLEGALRGGRCAERSKWSYVASKRISHSFEVEQQ